MIGYYGNHPKRPLNYNRELALKNTRWIKEQVKEYEESHEFWTLDITPNDRCILTPEFWKLIPGLSTRIKSAVTREQIRFPLIASIEQTDQTCLGEHLHCVFLVPNGIDIEPKITRIKSQIRKLSVVSEKSRSVNIRKLSSPIDCLRRFHYMSKQTTEHYDPLHHHKI